MAHDPNCAAGTNYPAKGGTLWNIGAILDILAGGKLTIADVDKTAALGTAVRTARGQATTVAAVGATATGCRCSPALLQRWTATQATIPCLSPRPSATRQARRRQARSTRDLEEHRWHGSVTAGCRDLR